MIGVLAEACRQLTYYSNFWLISALGDWSFEEGERNVHFRKYLESWHDPDLPLPAQLLCDARLGINGVLYELICRQPGAEPCGRNKSHGHDIVFLVSRRAYSVEVKYVYDCTLPKYHNEILADRDKQPHYQVIFFLSFPNYHRYPGGQRRQTKVVGIAAQYRKMNQLLGPASLPSNPPHCVDLPQGTDIFTQDRVQRRFRRYYNRDVLGEFSIAKHLSGGQVGFAIWDWSGELHDRSLGHL